MSNSRTSDQPGPAADGPADDPNRPFLDPSLVRKLTGDPFSLDHAERVEVMQALDREHARWLGLLEKLCEPPGMTEDFPAFLLETPHFADLRAAIEGAASASALDPGTADELQRFVDLYRGYMDPESQSQETDEMFLVPSVVCDGR